MEAETLVDSEGCMVTGCQGSFTVDRLDFPISAAVLIGSLLGRGVGKGQNRTFSEVAVFRDSRNAASDHTLVLWKLSAQRESSAVRVLLTVGS